MMINPILDRELKTRMRTWKTPILLTVYLVGIGLILALVVFASVADSYSYYRGFDPNVIPTIYDVIITVQMVLLMFIVPMLTATSVSGERQRQTLDLLLCTDISPWKIIFGKISAALIFVLLLVGATIPFMGTVLLFGGLSVLDILQVTLYYLVTSFMLASIGIFASIHFKKNITAIIMSYVIMGILYILPIMFISFIGIAASISNNYAISEFMSTYAYEVVVVLFGANPGFGLLSLMNNDIMDLSYLLGSSSTGLSNVAPWMISGFYFVIISVVALLLSKHRLSKLR